MREILFRGKVADEPDEWVQGYLRDADTIFQQTRHEKSKCCDYGFFSVKPETVGQYTGICDKKGKKIFEGDIVRVLTEPQNTNYAKINDCGVIEYKEETTEYVISFCHIRFDDEDFLGNFRNGMCEVIGNIHDNPELLEK